MTESQKRNARRRRALVAHRGLSTQQLVVSFKCHFWERTADFDRHFNKASWHLIDRIVEEILEGDREWGDWRDDSRWPDPDHHYGDLIRMSTVDIPELHLRLREGQEDTSDITGAIKGVLHALVKSIVPVLNPFDRSDRSLFEQLREYQVRLECDGQWGSRDPWRLKWRTVDVETVVADVIAAALGS